jgi:hypothetical protein
MCLIGANFLLRNSALTSRRSFLEWAAAVSGEDTHPDLSSAQPAQEEFGSTWLRTPPTLKQY